MAFLKEILTELCGMQNVLPKDRIPLVWSNDVINRVEIAANRENRLQRKQSHVRNDELPDDLGHTVSDYGDIRGGDDNEMRGYDGYSDGPQASGEYEELNDDENRLYNKAYEIVSQRWDGDQDNDKFARAVQDEFERLQNVGQEEQEDTGEQGPVGADQEQAPTDQEQAPTDEVSDEQIDDQYGEAEPDGENEFADDVEQEWDDPNLQGVIRTVPNSHLIYKRQQEDGTFNELWQYNIGDDFRKELEVRRSILAGTDIPPNKMSSPDNTQSFELWTAGNAQVMHVRGLPN